MRFNPDFYLSNQGVSNATDTLNLPRHRWYYYKEGFSPYLVEKAIESCELQKDDIILDPFIGSGTTAAAARELGRNFIGIDREPTYVNAARERVANVTPIDLSDIEVSAPKRAEPRIAFRELIDAGLLYVGQTLVSPRGERVMIANDGNLVHSLYGKASIHVMAARIQHCQSYNGWDYWSAQKRDGTLVSIDELRKYVRGIKRDMKRAA